MNKFAEIFKEIVDEYDNARKAWIEKLGNDIKFNEWFSNQIKGESNGKTSTI